MCQRLKNYSWNRSCGLILHYIKEFRFAATESVFYSGYSLAKIVFKYS